MRSLTVRGALAMLVAMTVLLGACTANSHFTDAASAGDRDTTESTPTEASKQVSPDGRTFSPEPGEVQALPQGRSYSATMRQGRYALRLSQTLAYHVDVPDLWTVVSGRVLNDGSGAIFFVAPAPTSTGSPEHPCRDHIGRIAAWSGRGKEA